MIAPQSLPILDIEPDEKRHSLGALRVNVGERPAFLPLTAVKIQADVADRVARISVTQKFHNRYPEPLEAVYIFPLTGGCAVSAFDIQIGSRTIHGMIRERGEARREYQEALDQGKRAALLEQERDDVFTMQVGNIPPGEEITVHLTASQELPYFESGSTELRLPLVVAPRYIPGQPIDSSAVGTGVESDTTDVPDASRITPPRLVDGVDSGVRLSLEVTLQAGHLADMTCSQHATRTTFGPDGIKVALADDADLMDRDFILRWTIAGPALLPRFLVHRGLDGTYGMLSLVPPARPGSTALPRDVVFVLDRSGSMGGPKMASAARACAILLGTLGPQDHFGVLDFDTENEWFEPGEGARIVSATPANVSRGLHFLRGIGARGGTEIEPALLEALTELRAAAMTSPKRPGRTPVVVLVTDGEIGNENQVLKTLSENLNDARVFTVGVDTAVNESFLKKLARQSGGTCTCVTPGDALESALEEIGREIGAPLMTGIKLEIAGVPTVETANPEADSAIEMTPSRIPDLFAGRPVTLFLKLDQARDLRIRGQLSNGGVFDEIVASHEIEQPAIAHLWARSRVTDLEDRFRMEPGPADQIRADIIELSIRHTVLSRFTAFVAVDHEEIVNQDGTRRTVTQPVPMPAQWETMAQPAALSAQFQYRLGGISPQAVLMSHLSRTVASSATPPKGSVEDKLSRRWFGPTPPRKELALEEIRTSLDSLELAIKELHTPGSTPDRVRVIGEICDRTAKLVKSARLGKRLKLTMKLLKTLSEWLKTGVDAGSADLALFASLMNDARIEISGLARPAGEPFWGKTV